MNKHCVILISMFLISLSVNAKPLDDSNNESPENIILEKEINPEEIADSIITFVPSRSMDLHKPKLTERIIKGKIDKVEKGKKPNLIILTPNTFTTPLTEGVPKKIFLKRYPDRDAYYPIAIFPVNYKNPVEKHND